MTTESETIEGKDQPPSPKSADKYASYYELNEEKDEGVGIPKTEVPVETVDKPVDDKPPVEPSPTEKQVHKPNWQKRIDKQTAKIRNLETQLAELQKAKVPEKDLQKYKRENFVSDEEFEAHKDKLDDQRISSKLIAEKEKDLMAEKNSAQEEAFAISWQGKVDDNFEGDPEGRAELSAEIQKQAIKINGWHQDIHDYLEGSDVSPRMMQVLLLRPDIVDQIATSKPIIRAKLLTRLETEIENVMNARSAVPAPTAKPTVTKAPAPTGTIGVGNGNVLSDDDADNASFKRYMKQKHGGK